jgi:dTDP-glucose 4,6-dehydratase/UDP-glucose 4-epimerase
LVKAIALVIENSHFENDFINVANGIELTIKSISEMFYSIYEPSTTIQFQGQARSGDPINWVADISKLKEMGYSNNMDLNTGLTKYVAWLKENE